MNLLFQGMTSYLANAPFIVKLGLNLVIRRLNTQPMVKMSVYNYLWNNSDPLLTLVSKIAPSMVPIDNLGVLDLVSALSCEI
jgi:hypothetical protein